MFGAPGFDALERAFWLPLLLGLVSLPLILSFPPLRVRLFAGSPRRDGRDPAIPWPAHAEIAEAGGRGVEWLPHHRQPLPVYAFRPRLKGRGKGRL